jgi:hypothetical protein
MIQIPVTPPAELDLAGFARLFEGEGTVVLSWRKGREHRPTLAICIQMIDRDVIEAVQRHAGGTVCAFRRRNRPQNKRLWQWNLQGEAAANLGVSMLPYLFQRRREQMVNNLNAWAGSKYQYDPELKKFRRGCA